MEFIWIVLGIAATWVVAAVVYKALKTGWFFVSWRLLGFKPMIRDEKQLRLTAAECAEDYIHYWEVKRLKDGKEPDLEEAMRQFDARWRRIPRGPSRDTRRTGLWGRSLLEETEGNARVRTAWAARSVCAGIVIAQAQQENAPAKLEDSRRGEKNGRLSVVSVAGVGAGGRVAFRPPPRRIIYALVENIWMRVAWPFGWRPKILDKEMFLLTVGQCSDNTSPNGGRNTRR